VDRSLKKLILPITILKNKLKLIQFLLKMKWLMFWE